MKIETALLFGLVAVTFGWKSGHHKRRGHSSWDSWPDMGSYGQDEGDGEDSWPDMGSYGQDEGDGEDSWPDMGSYGQDEGDGEDSWPWAQSMPEAETWGQPWAQAAQTTSAPVTPVPLNAESQPGCACASRNIDVDEKLRLLGKDNDNNNDGVVTYADIKYDADTRYDVNHDGIETERECIDQMACLYGNTEQVARFICVLLAGGVHNESITAFNNPPFDQGQALGIFLQTNRDRYTRFAKDRCVNRYLSEDEKLDIIVDANNNYNDDNRITQADIQQHMSLSADTDKDGEVSRAEWVAYQVCLFEVTGDFSRFHWSQLFGDAASVRITDFGKNARGQGLTLAEFREENRKLMEQFRMQDVSNYIMGGR